jgi:hypothetical protein
MAPTGGKGSAMACGSSGWWLQTRREWVAGEAKLAKRAGCRDEGRPKVRVEKAILQDKSRFSDETAAARGEDISLSDAGLARGSYSSSCDGNNSWHRKPAWYGAAQQKDSVTVSPLCLAARHQALHNYR